MNRRLRLSVLALLLAAPSLAASPHWMALGPFGGDLQSLTLDPTNPLTLYANTGFQGGTYRTLDGGLSWEPIQALQSLGNVLDLAVAAAGTMVMDGDVDLELAHQPVQ